MSLTFPFLPPLLRCPVCHDALTHVTENGRVACSRCQKAWTVTPLEVEAVEVPYDADRDSLEPRAGRPRLNRA